MKKTIIALTVCCMLTGVSAFTSTQLPTGKQAKSKTIKTNGPAWIACIHGYIHSCDDFVERYYVRDGEAGDTYEWYWDPNNPSIPTQYLGSNNYADVTMAPGDVLYLIVHSETYGTYEYWDTAPPCED